MESGVAVVELGELVLSKVSRRPVRWVLAVPNESPIQSVKDLEGKRIATEVVNLTSRWLADHNVNAHVEFSWGATEAKPPLLADAIVEVTETGNSLSANNLRVVCELLQSTTRFIANDQASQDRWKRRKMDDLFLMLNGAIAAEGKVGLMMNVREDHLERVISILPALQNPTISKLSDGHWVAVNTILDESRVRELVPHSRRLVPAELSSTRSTRSFLDCSLNHQRVDHRTPSSSSSRATSSRKSSSEIKRACKGPGSPS